MLVRNWMQNIRQESILMVVKRLIDGISTSLNLKTFSPGVDTYWLSKPLRTSVQQRHTVTLEGGDEALRYRMYVGYNNSPYV